MFLLILIIVLLVSYFSKDESKPSSSEELGIIGENKVRNSIGDTNGKQYVINDLRIKDVYGNMAQIDHVVINRYGIHVIETKNWSGVISGNKDNVNWVESFPGSNKVFSLYNPIKQNETHIKRLRSVLGYIPMNNIVCFTNPNVKINGMFDEVCTINKLNEKLHIGTMNYSDKTVDSLYREIRKYQIK